MARSSPFCSMKSETIAMLPGGWELAHAIRLGIKPLAELGANSEALSGSQLDSPCSCRAIFESAPVAMLQSRISRLFPHIRESPHSSSADREVRKNQSQGPRPTSLPFEGTQSFIPQRMPGSMGACGLSSIES
jgi:hypothetical protein